MDCLDKIEWINQPHQAASLVQHLNNFPYCLDQVSLEIINSSFAYLPFFFFVSDLKVKRLRETEGSLAKCP